MAKSIFVYVTYIRTTPKKLWQALVTPEFQRKYWIGTHIESDLMTGSPWKLIYDGGVMDSGTVVESIPPKRLVLKWRNEFSASLKAEGFSRCTMELEPQGQSVKLTITHEMNRPKSVFIGKVSGGWPFILSNLKSLLETGKIAVKSFK